MPSPPLKLFTAPWITRAISLPLFARLFGRFTHLLPNKYSLPRPSADNESYFDSLAQTLELPSGLPDSLIDALHEIEASAATLFAAPDSNPGSDSAETESSRLRQAIQLWLSSHPESNDLRRQIAAPKSNEGGSPAQAGPPIPQSKIPNSDSPQQSINPPIHQSNFPPNPPIHYLASAPPRLAHGGKPLA